MADSKESGARSEAEAARQMEAIISTHETALLRYAGGVLNNPHAAQDVVQNVFVKLFRNWKPGWQPTASLRPWLYRVTHNEAVDYVRRESRLKLLHLGHAREEGIRPPASDNPGPEAAEKMEAVLAHLRKLDPPEQQVVLLRLQEGLSYKEISEVTGRTEGNVGCLLHHAVKKLARLVQKETSG